MEEESIWDSPDFWENIDEEAELLEDDVVIQDEAEFEDDDYSMFDEVDEDFINLEMEGFGKYLPPKTSSNSRWSFTNSLVGKESGGDYQAYNSAGGGEGAVGKYQFRWTLHSPKIKEYAASKGINIKSKEDFMNSPTLQDGFYEEYWVPNEIMPAVNRLKRQFGNTLSDEQYAKLVHFRGEGGAGQYLRGEIGDKPESYNSSISSYLKMQGGGITESPIYIDYNYQVPQSPTSVEIDPRDMQDLDLSNITETISGNVVSEESLGNLNNISSLGGKALDLYKKFNDVKNRAIAKNAGTISNTISTINNQYAENRNNENLQQMFRRLRDRPYYNRVSELNNNPIYT